MVHRLARHQGLPQEDVLCFYEGSDYALSSDVIEAAGAMFKKQADKRKVKKERIKKPKKAKPRVRRAAKEAIVDIESRQDCGVSDQGPSFLVNDSTVEDQNNLNRRCKPDSHTLLHDY